jgi:formate hydrogenlyase subunit 6/NADH:ubiquinone oxidoreductase subunit I
MEMTTGNPNQLLVDLDKCIGCWACTHACPAELITFADNDRQRVLRFARTCSEDCTCCAEVCPEEAITLTPVAEVGRLSIAAASEYLTATFDLLRCQQCDAPFTTERIVNKLLAVVPQEFQADAADLSWIRLCPDCRQLTEGEKAAKEWIMSRWPGG